MSGLADLAAGGLATRWLGRPREHHAVVDSTNARALAWASAGAPHGALVTADAQTAGRGRRGRAWSSPPGGDLYATAVVRPEAGTELGALGLAVAVGLREGLPAHVQLKWPNDLWVAGRKLGGILCEAQWEADRARVAVGFGINLRARDWPPELAGIATTLQDVTGQAHDAAAVLPRLLVALEAALDDYLRGGFPAIRGRYVPHCTVLGRRIRLGDAEDPRGATEATAVDLDVDGALLVRDRPGAGLRRVEAADVWLAR